MRRMLVATAVAMGLAVPASAQAGSDDWPAEPALSFRLQFGGSGRPDAALGLRLRYGPELRRSLFRTPDAELPSLTEWTVGLDGAHVLRLNGLALGSGRLWLNDHETEEVIVHHEEPGFWHDNMAALVLAGGAALAVVIAVAGDTADDISEDYSPFRGSSGSSNGDDDGNGGDDECSVPAPDTGGDDGCIIGSVVSVGGVEL